jgi:Phage integrase, N-terminal SAM-like domain
VARTSKLRRTHVRSRHQNGRVEERGTQVKRWYGHYYVYMRDEAGKETRHHVGVSLGEKSKLRKWEAEDRLRKIIANATKSQPRPGHLTLEWYAGERFLPMRQPQWAPSTKETNLYILNSHILPALGDKALCELEKFHCQVFLNDLAGKGFSFTVVDHCRTMLKAICDEAVDADLIGKNPARKLVNPETKEPHKTRTAERSGTVASRFPSLPGPTHGDDRCVLRNAARRNLRPSLVFTPRGSFSYRRHRMAWNTPPRQGKDQRQQGLSDNSRRSAPRSGGVARAERYRADRCAPFFQAIKGRPCVRRTGSADESSRLPALLGSPFR